MNATIYIRKENEDKWNDIHDKSAWINTLLNNSDNTKEYGKVIRTPVGPAVTVLGEEMSIDSPEPKKALTRAQKDVASRSACKHGYHPSLCKYSKNGKPCK